jgi:hypothetical protein
MAATSLPDNLRRIARIIASVDRAPEGEAVVVPLRYRLPISHTLARLSPEAASGAAQPSTTAEAARRITVPGCAPTVSSSRETRRVSSACAG